MKLNEIKDELQMLLELREILDRSRYGCWIDSKTMQIHYVEDYKHVTFLKNYMLKHNLAPAESIKQAHNDLVYQTGFSLGWVRVVTETNHVIGIEGLKKSIEKVAIILLSSCMQPGVVRVHVDRKETAGAPPSGKTFSLPERRRDLMMYLKNETDDFVTPKEPLRFKD